MDTVRTDDPSVRSGGQRSRPRSVSYQAHPAPPPSATATAPCSFFSGAAVSFRELDAAVDRFAAALQTLGVRKGDRVALMLPNCPQFGVAFYGALRAGATVLGLNPLYTAHELGHVLRDSGAETFVVLAPMLRVFDALGGDTPVRRVVVTGLDDAMPAPVAAGYVAKARAEGTHAEVPEREGVYRYARLLADARGAPTPVEVDVRRDTAVVAALAPAHEVVQASHSRSPERVDITDADSIRALFDRVGPVDAVVSTSGNARCKPLAQLTDDDFAYCLRDELMGQVDLARIALADGRVRDGGSVTLTSGTLAQHPMPGSAAISLVNAALEGFGRAAALEAPRGIRVNVVSPGWVAETLSAIGRDPSAGVPADVVARAYVESATGTQTGAVLDASG